MDEQLLAAIEGIRSAIADLQKGVEVRAVEDAETDLDTHIGEPTPKQLKEINTLISRESEADEWLVVPYRASDNLVDLDYQKWHPSAVAMMGMTFKGRPLMLDHAWGNSDKAFAFIFDSKLIQEESASRDILNAGGFEKLNKKIINKEGHVWLYLCAAVPQSSAAVDAILNRVYGDCSTGSVLHKGYEICPNCSEEMGRDVGIYELDEDDEFICPHVPPSRLMHAIANHYSIEFNFADYVIVGGEGNKAVELSNCIQGQLPAASIIRD